MKKPDRAAWRGRPKVAAVIPAAGLGVRLGMGIPKALVSVGGMPLFARTLKRLKRAHSFRAIIMPISGESRKRVEFWAKKLKIKNVEFCQGGKTRAESVLNGIKSIGGRADWVLIHDVARPFITGKDVKRVIAGALKTRASILAEPSKATVKVVYNGSDRIQCTLDRTRVYLAQTPQVFGIKLLEEAYRRLGRTLSRYTDEAAMVEAIGHKVKVVCGSDLNFKITSKSDLRYANYLAEKDR